MTTAQRWIEIKLQGQSGARRLRVEPYATEIGAKWFAAVRRSLEVDRYLDKNQLFHGWVHGHFQLESLCEQINRAIDQINRFGARASWQPVPFIADKLRPAEIDQKLMNLIHHSFETLIGQAWAISPYYQEADEETRYAILMLNMICHEIENLLEAQANHARRPDDTCSTIRVNFMNAHVDRQPLGDADYDHFEIFPEHGEVTLAYCQSGKTHLEAWNDRDEQILDGNINGLRYSSCGFMINFGPTLPPTDKDRLRSEFFSWLTSRGADIQKATDFIDHQGVRQGLGWLKVGRLIDAELTSKSIPELQTVMAGYDDVTQLSLVDGETSVCQNYDYRRTDAAHDRLMAFVNFSPVTRQDPVPPFITALD